MRTRIFTITVMALCVTLVWLFFTEEHTLVKRSLCTAESLMCPDGTIVGKVAPNCAFAPCPSVNTVPDVVVEDDTVVCTMDAKICPDGSAVGRTAPNCEFAECPQPTTPIVVTSPLRDQEITSPVTISGNARGMWFFEGSFPISIVNWDGLIIGEGIAQAEGEWMTENFVPFTAVISYTLATGTPYNRGAIILKKDNPSGLPEHDDAIEIPVTLQ